jgi:hypothetical protein
MILQLTRGNGPYSLHLSLHLFNVYPLHPLAVLSLLICHDRHPVINLNYGFFIPFSFVQNALEMSQQ